MADPFFPICQIGKLTLFRHAGEVARSAPGAGAGVVVRLEERYRVAHALVRDEHRASRRYDLSSSDRCSWTSLVPRDVRLALPQRACDPLHVTFLPLRA